MNPIPGIDIPGIDIPGIDIPGIDIPGIDIPGIDTSIFKSFFLPCSSQLLLRSRKLALALCLF